MEGITSFIYFSPQFGTLEHYEEYRPPRLHEVLHPLVSRLFYLSKEPIINYEPADDQKEVMSRIKGQLPAFDPKEIEGRVNFILGRIQIIMDRKRSYSAENDLFTKNYTAVEVEQMDRQLVEELQYYQRSLTQLLEFLSIETGKAPQSQNKQISSKPDLIGLTLHAIADTQEERNNKINAFCERLGELELIDSKDRKLIKPAFTGAELPRKVNWVTEAYNLGYLIYLLGNSGGQSYIKSTDRSRFWKRSCEVFTVQGRSIEAANLKTNRTPTDPKIKSALDGLIDLLR